MGQFDAAIRALKRGESITIRPRGDSMLPRIKSGQRVELRPPADGEPRKGQVALVRVRGRVLLHKVAQVSGPKLLITSQRGKVNGWTTRARCFGVADL